MWWKYGTIALLLYVFVFGMLVPLKPGIESVAPGAIKSGRTIDLKVKGYNTFYKTGEKSLRAWLKYDENHTLTASSISAEDEQHLTAHFEIPVDLPDDKKNIMLTLLVDNEADGVSLMPSAVSVTKDPNIGGFLPPVDWSSKASSFSIKNDFAFPYRSILNETIRSLYYHVPLWFAMIAVFTASLWYSIVYLRNSGPDGNYTLRREADMKAQALAEVGLIFGILGLVTGMVWANYTWGAPWSGDVKQNMSAVLLMVYFAYVILRMAFDDEEKSARLGAVYNIFAYASIFPLLFVIPRLTDSLHPGNGGNPAMGGEDLDNTMRMVFYPGVIAFILLGFWLAQIIFRIKRLRETQYDM